MLLVALGEVWGVVRVILLERTGTVLLLRKEEVGLETHRPVIPIWETVQNRCRRDIV